MDHILEILKIVDGAIKRDYSKVLAYTDLLAKKLKADGEVSAAKKITTVLEKSNSTKLTIASGGNRELPIDDESKLSLAEREFVSEDDSVVILDEDVKAKFRDVGKAAQDFSKSVAH